MGIGEYSWLVNEVSITMITVCYSFTDCGKKLEGIFVNTSRFPDVKTIYMFTIFLLNISSSFRLDTVDTLLWKATINLNEFFVYH